MMQEQTASSAGCVVEAPQESRWLRESPPLSANVAERFWSHVFADSSIPTGFPPSLGKSYVEVEDSDTADSDYRMHSGRLDAAAVLGLSRWCGYQVDTAIRAVWALLLSRYNDQADVIVCGLVYADGEQLLLPIHTQVDEELAVADWLGRFAAAEADAFRHRVPKSRLCELQGDANLARFSTDAAAVSTVLGEFSKLDAAERPRVFLETTPDPRGKCRLYVRPGRFRDDAPEKIVAHFERLIRNMAADSDRTLRDVPCLLLEETQRILIDWNATSRAVPTDRCLHELIEQAAKRYPERPAVVDHEKEMAYAELDAKAETLARFLRGFGVGPGHVVCVFLTHCADMVVAILGVLKSGAAYLPLDPSYPEDRIGFIVEDSGADLILTQETLVPLLPITAPTVAIDTQWSELAAAKFEGPPAKAGPDDTAYVMYTSGSTGKPKGVRIRHRNVVNHCAFFVGNSELTPEDRVLGFCSIGFDISVEEIFPALVAGAAVVLRQSEAAYAPDTFIEWLRQEWITLVTLPTGFFLKWLDGMESLGLELPPALRIVYVGGEKISATVYDRWMAGVGREVPLWNSYGPTEAAVAVASFAYTDPAAPPLKDVPIGRPNWNSRLYILDRFARPVPVGVPGEVYIGGANVGAGYLNRPDQTTYRFVDDPFCDDPDARLFRTGDIGWWAADGNMMIGGRIDFQVKIRGYRIEPGEIETLLLSHPWIKEAFVDAVTLGEEKRLVGYVATRWHRKLTTRGLRKWLSSRIPPYALPWTFVFVKRLPLTINGKIDRGALPRPESARTAGEDFVPPETITQKKLASIFSRLLKVDRVGIDDGFFDLGGHSLDAMELGVLVEKEFGRTICPSLLATKNTVAELATVLDEGEAAFSPLVPLETEGNGDPIFFVPGVTGEAMPLRSLAERFLGERPFYAFQTPGYLEGQKPIDDIPTMAAYFVRSLLNIHPEGPFHLGGFCFGAAVAYEMAIQLRAAGNEIASLSIVDFELENSPYLSGSRRSWAHLKRFLRNLPRWFFAAWAAFGLRWAVSMLWGHATHDLARLGAALHLPVRRGDEAADEDPEISPAEWYMLSERHHEVWAAHYRASIRYRPKNYDGSIGLIFTKARPLFYSLTPEKHWRELTSGPVRTWRIRGLHHSVLEEPYVDGLAEAMQENIAWSEGAARKPRG